MDSEVAEPDWGQEPSREEQQETQNQGIEYPVNINADCNCDGQHSPAHLQREETEENGGDENCSETPLLWTACEVSNIERCPHLRG